MLGFSPVVRIGTPPPPRLQASVCTPPPPFGSGGETRSLAGEGVGGSQFGQGDRHCDTLSMYVLCDPPPPPTTYHNPADLCLNVHDDVSVYFPPQQFPSQHWTANKANLQQSWPPPWCERPACSWSSPRFQKVQVYSRHHLSAPSNPAHLDDKWRASEIKKNYAANMKEKNSPKC